MTVTRRTVDYRIAPFDLHLFSEVVSRGTITAAAEAVNLSLAAASARLKALEDAAGTRLLVRSKAGAAPTDAGRAMARHANRVLAELETLHVEMASFGHGLRGTVRLLCNTAAMAEALPQALGRFLASNPEIDVDVREMASDAIHDALHRGFTDIGIVADYVNTSGLIIQPWRSDRLVALLPRNWSTTNRRSIKFGELLEQPLVGLTSDSGLSRFLAAQASRSGRVPRHRARLSAFYGVAQLVATGVGAAVMPESAAVRLGNQDVRILPLSDSWAERKLLVCMTTQGAQLVGVKALADALISDGA